MAQAYDLQNNLIHLLGLETWPEDKRQALIAQATELIQKRLVIRLTEALKPEDADAVNAVADDPEKAMAVLVEKSGLDLPTIIQEEVRKLAEEMKPLADV